MMPTVDLENTHIFDAVLEEGEFLVWTGRPDPKAIFTTGDAAMVPVGCFFSCFSFIWVMGASGASLLMGFFGMPFLLMGLYLAGGRFLYKKNLRERSFYGLSNRRAIILKAFPEEIVETVNLQDCSAITKESKVGGKGTIIFGSAPDVVPANQIKAQPDMGFEIFNKHKSIGPLRFSDIEGVEDVYQRIQFIRMELSR